MMNSLREGEKLETVSIPDLDGDYDQLSRSLAGVKKNFEKFLLVKCSKWVLQELKGKLQLIESVRRKVKDHQLSGTQVGHNVGPEVKEKDNPEDVTEDHVNISTAVVEPSAQSTPRQSLAGAGHYSEEEVRQVIREFIPDGEKLNILENFLHLISDGCGRVSKKMFDVILEESPRLFSD